MFVRFLSVLRNEAGEGDGGGDGPAAEATEPTDKEPAKPKAKEPEQLGKPKTVGDLKAKTFAERAKEATKATEAMLREKREAKAAAKAEPKDDADDKPEPAAKDEPSDKADKTAKAIEKAGGDAPDQKANETDKAYEARLVKALQDLRGAETQTKQQKARADAAELKAATLEKEKAAFEKRLARAKTPEERLDFMADEMGCTLEELIKDINEGKTKPPGQRPRVDPAIQAEMEAQKAEIARLAKLATDREEKEKAEAQERSYKDHVTQASGWLKEHADEFPALQAIPWAAASIVRAAYQNGGDMGEPARKLQEDMVRDFAAMLGVDAAHKLLDGKMTPEAKALLSKRYAAATAAAKPDVVKVPEHTRKPPSRVTTETPTPEKARKGMSMEERKSIASAALSKHLDAQKAARG
jgi:hypothetical protein